MAQQSAQPESCFWPPGTEHAQNKTQHKPGQAETTAVLGSLMEWIEPGEGTPTVIFLLSLLQ